MLTYELKKAPGLPLYESLYRSLRASILSGELAPGEKLPSKRALAEHLEVSKITVENAYQQLLSEGYICSREKVGYFVEQVTRPQHIVLPEPEAQPSQPEFLLDLTANGPAGFPFSVWNQLQRQVIQEHGRELLHSLPNQGLLPLRRAIAKHLADFRGMRVDPESIVMGAGTDFLYNLLIQLLGRDQIYAVEEPGYGKIRRIYAAGGVRCVSAVMDGAGVVPESLGDAHVLHISPSHHFPTGLVTPIQRRQALLCWAESREGWIIEDDYDSEFRFHAHPMPTLQALDRSGRVIYMNTFSKTLAPSIRISYMVLPEQLMEQFQKELGFYSCTVPSFEQYTLERFLHLGYFEKHLNRMRKAYKLRRNLLVTTLREWEQAGKLTILEQDAGLHFLLKVDTQLTDEALVEVCAREGIRVQSLGSFYAGSIPEEDRHCLVINYSGLHPQQIQRLGEKLRRL